MGVCLIILAVVVVILKRKRNGNDESQKNTQIVIENLVYDENINIKSVSNENNNKTYEEPVTHNPDYISSNEPDEGKYITRESLYNTVNSDINIEDE